MIIFVAISRIAEFLNINIEVCIFFSQSMELIGGNEMKLSPFKKGNITYVFPNKVSLFVGVRRYFSFIW